MEQSKNITHKHSAAGFIPKEWEVNNLEKIAEFRNGKAHENIVDSEGKYIIINSKFISTEGEVAKYSKEILCPLSKGEIVMVMSDVPNGKAIAKCFYVKEDNLYTLNQRICAITAKKVDPIFLYYALNRNKYYLTFDDGVNQTNLRKEEVLECPIPLPPLPEQKAIAQVLSTADAAIHTIEKLIAQKELRKKWLMQQLLTGKQRLKGFDGEWKEHSYEKILKVVKRNFDWDENELYKLISVRRRSGGIFYREALYGHQILVKTLRTAIEGDFLFSKMQILHGASALVTKEFDGAKISGSYIAVVPKDKKQLNMEFFQWYSQTPYFYHQTYISSYGVHIEKMTFDFDTFLQLEMKLPSIEEQTAIAQVLQAADKEISLLKAKAAKLREQKKGLMQVLLTGKKRLKIN
ncbi:restriction endonuclease subunit S [Ferruginibacter yonginensis]|uniref:Restriction endonuclease subunit S n=1 Tax=Ferruginibacter yonginensis TaxID=1310416 RepID=A0ABV8QM66_9BACT